MSHWNKIGNLFKITDYSVSWQSLWCCLIELWSRLNKVPSTSRLKICLGWLPRVWTPIYVNRNMPSQVNQQNTAIINLSLNFRSQFNKTWILKRTEKIILLAIIYVMKLPSLGAHRIFENRLQFPLKCLLYGFLWQICFHGLFLTSRIGLKHSP